MEDLFRLPSSILWCGSPGGLLLQVLLKRRAVQQLPHDKWQDGYFPGDARAEIVAAHAEVPDQEQRAGDRPEWRKRRATGERGTTRISA